MEFGVLGPLEVEDAGRRIELASPKQRALLALLLVDRGSVVSTDRIVEELWGSGTVADHQNAVWVQVSNLRSVLEPGRPPRSEGSFVLTRPPGYVLDVPADAVDAGRFEHLIDEGRALVARDPAAASIVLGEALALWRGHAYEEFTYESFAQQEIARLDELRLEAVEARIDADLARGLGGELTSELLTLTRQHPLRERFTAQLMLAEYRSGRRTEALRAYRSLKTRLARESGLDPSTELQELEERIVRDDPALTAPSPPVGTSATGPAVRGYELRRELARDELRVVHAAYQPDVGREVAITTVASELADDPDFIRRFEDDTRVAAALEHPHIVPLYDYWREPGAAYLVTRLLPGGSLRDILETRALTSAETARMVEDVAGALDAAHARGVVHGHVDDDVIVFDDDGRAYVTGFGVGRGSAPAGGVDEIRPGADVSALGVVAAHALTGITGPLPAVEGALPRPVADVLRHASELGSAGRLACELGAALDGGPRPAVRRVEPGRPVENPYRGLAPFTRADAAVFHGRERVVERLVGRLAMPGVDGRFVAVVGPSGSGKSSVVLAGLLPGLSADAVPGSSGWFVTTMTPGTHPFEALEAALLRVAVSPPPTLYEQLTGGDHGLRRAVRRILPDDDAELLLVIDQFEETFTLAEPTVVDSFLDSIVAAVGDADARLRVVLTVRADFYDRPLRHRALSELLRGRTEIIGPMSLDELEAAIVEPAGLVGVGYSPGLVAEMIAEVEGRPGALPLLQYTLTELFDRRRGDVIDREDYRAIGGVSGAIAARAEALFADGDRHEQEATREVFLRLVTLGEGVHDTRRRVAVSELEDLPFRGRAVDAVLERYTTHRLLTADRDPVTRSPTVEISHEALLTEWDRLRRWIDTAREDLRFQRRLHLAMCEWIDAGRSEDQLLTGGLLTRLRSWVSESGVQLGGSEREYLELSVAAHEREVREAEAREAERRAAETRARRRLGYSVVAVAVAIVVGAMAVVAWSQRREAERSEDTIAATLRSQDLAAASAVHLRSDPDLATRLALESAAATAELGFVTPEALDALHWAIQEANVVYPADETTPVAVRPGPRGATGVFALPPDDTIALARSTDPGQFTPGECAELFPGGGCPDPTRTTAAGLEVQGGDEAYGVVAATAPGALDGTQVELIDYYLGDVGYDAEIARFEDETGITVARPAAVEAGPELGRRIDQRQPLPDVVVWSTPAVLAEQQPTSGMIDLSAYLDMDRVRDDLGSTLVSLGTVGDDGSWPSSQGALVGLPVDRDIKGLVYYPKDDFDAAGYEIPETYDELLALSERIVGDGGTPWCFDFEVGPATGSPGTDLIETLVLREGGPEIYDAWTRHDIPFDAPEIRAAAGKAETLLLSDGFVFGGSDTISEQPWLSGLEQLLKEEPGCWLYHSGDFALGALPTSARPGVDVDVFPFPPLERGDAVPLSGGGSMFSIHADRPETRVFVRHVAAPTWGEEWAAPPLSQFLSPNARFDVAAYGRDAAPDVAAVQRAVGEMNRAAVADGTFRFDASDLMPGRIGSWDLAAGTDPFQTRGEFWRGMVDVVDGVRTMDEVLSDIEIAWRELEAEQSN